MAQPYIGEIRMFAGNFPPVGWMFCEGQLLPISENDALFALIGTTYGGDGQETFGLPNLQSRFPIHAGIGPDLNNYPLAQMAGTESETLTVQQIPVHTHGLLVANAVANDPNPVNTILGESSAIRLYNPVNPTVPMNAGSISPQGGSQPHENMQPFLCINFIISLFGLFPQPQP